MATRMSNDSVWCFITTLIFSHFLCRNFVSVQGRGLMLLYRPRDITNDCILSHHLRYDVSFGMGMADTITLVLRTESELDYQCVIEIVTDVHIHLIVVIRFPSEIGKNCLLNQNGITIFNKNICQTICEVIGSNEIMTPYFILSTKRQVKLHFMSNSSINSELNATQYQITATAARLKPPLGCAQDNETLCTTLQDEFCFTSGVVCDGIKNCGVPDWFDERKSDCGMPQERLTYAPVIAVVAAVLCALMVVSHFLFRCLPPLTNTFFIFNTNEDNRLCIDPILVPPDNVVPVDNVVMKKLSIIPVPSSSSSSEVEIGKKELIFAESDDPASLAALAAESMDEQPRRITVRSMSAKIQKKLRSLKRK